MQDGEVRAVVVSPKKGLHSRLLFPFALGRRNDVQRAPERPQDLERLSYLSGGLPGLEVNDKTLSNAGGAGELVLPLARGFAGSADDVAYIGRSESS